MNAKFFYKIKRKIMKINIQYHLIKCKKNFVKC